MEIDINLKHLLYEIKIRIKVIVLVSILISCVLCVYSYFSIKGDIEAQTFGSYGEIYVEHKIGSGDNSIYNDIASILTCNDVLNNVVNNSNLSNTGLSKEDIRSMIYLKEKYSNVILIYVISDNQDTAQEICNGVLNYGGDYLAEHGLDNEVNQFAKTLGSVSIDVQQFEGKDYYNIIPISGVQLNVRTLLIRCVVGLFIGLFLCCAFVSLAFIIRDDIVYEEQIEERLDLHVLATVDESFTQSIMDIYYNTYALNKKKLAISIANIGEPDSYNAVIAKLLEMFNSLNKKSIIINCRNTDQPTNIHEQIMYSGVQSSIDLQTITTDDKRNEFFEDKEKVYDCLLFDCGCIEENQYAKLYMKSTDGVIIVVKSRTVKVKQLQQIKKELSIVGTKILGIVLIK